MGDIDEAAERKKFEAELVTLLGLGYDASRIPVTSKTCPGEYCHTTVEIAWRGWLARARRERKEVERG